MVMKILSSLDLKLILSKGEKVVLRNNKATTISIRFTEEEKDMLNHASFMKCVPIADIIREGLKLYFNDSSAFETGTEKRLRVWKI
jgi:predicted DNA-binding protein